MMACSEATREKIRTSFAKRKALGLPIGKRKEITEAHNTKIRELRAKGYSLNKIADELKISTWPVQLALKNG